LRLAFECLDRLLRALVVIGIFELSDCRQPRPVVHGYLPDDSFWPTDDGQHSLTAQAKPDAQGAVPKVSFAVLYSTIARPGFGQ